MGPLGDAHPPTVVPRRCATLYVLLVCISVLGLVGNCPLPCGAGSDPVILTSPAVSGAVLRRTDPASCVVRLRLDSGWRTRREESGSHRLACGIGRGFEWADVSGKQDGRQRGRRIARRRVAEGQSERKTSIEDVSGHTESHHPPQPADLTIPGRCIACLQSCKWKHSANTYHGGEERPIPAFAAPLVRRLRLAA